MIAVGAILIVFSVVAGGEGPFVCPPYLRDIRMRSVRIAWKQRRPNAPAWVRIRLPGAAYRVTSLGPGRAEDHGLRRYTFSGLRPGTAYEYGVRVGRDGTWTSGRFETQPEGDAPFAFLVFGDTRHEVEVHRLMVELLAGEGATLALHTGDVVHRASEALFERFFRIEQPLVSQVLLLPALGNHELSGSWSLGWSLFESYFELPDRGPTPGVSYRFVYGNSLFLFLDTNKELTGSRQEAWAEERLLEAAMDPEIRHVFVVLHHGPLSSGPHGPNWDVLSSDLFEAFQRYGVDIVFSGHDHLYERGRVGRLWYVVTAGGGAPLYPIKRVLSTTQVVETTYHYVLVRVRGPEVEVTARRLDGSLLDWFHFVSEEGTWAGATDEANMDPEPRTEGTALGRLPAPRSRPVRGRDRGRRRAWPFVLAGLLALGALLAALGALRRSHR